jgi:DNA-directed RNA polymerase subunit RPC12/RpoP
MHYVRKVNQGEGYMDPRHRIYFIYRCSVCGHERDYNYVENFDTSRLRKCPNCGVIDDTNDREYLIKRQHDLEQEIKILEVQRNKCTAELIEVTAKLKTNQEIIRSTFSTETIRGKTLTQ